MADRTQKINFALQSIPVYNGDPNKLSNFINSVNTIQNLFGTLSPPLDAFDSAVIFLNIKSKITERALDSIKDLEFSNWDELRSHLVNTFKDKTNSVTIINEILKIQTIKNPYKLLEVTKEKFLSFKSRISIEENDPGTKLVIIKFAEKLIINNFISTVNDPYRNNLATRNPQTITDVETLLQNDFQYLKPNDNLNQKPTRQITNNPHQNFPQTRFPTGPINLQNRNSSNQVFCPKQQFKNAQDINPTPMSIQSRQTFQPRQNNYFSPRFTQQSQRFRTQSPNYVAEEINNTETCENNFTSHDENNTGKNNFLDLTPHILEKS